MRSDGHRSPPRISCAAVPFVLKVLLWNKETVHSKDRVVSSFIHYPVGPLNSVDDDVRRVGIRNHKRNTKRGRGLPVD